MTVRPLQFEKNRLLFADSVHGGPFGSLRFTGKCALAVSMIFFIFLPVLVIALAPAVPGYVDPELAARVAAERADGIVRLFKIAGSIGLGVLALVVVVQAATTPKRPRSVPRAWLAFDE